MHDSIQELEIKASDLNDKINALTKVLYNTKISNLLPYDAKILLADLLTDYNYELKHTVEKLRN